MCVVNKRIEACRSCSCFLARLFINGLTENAGPEIDGPKKNNRLKMSDMKLTDQTAGHASAGHENAGQENAKTRTTCCGSKAINLCQLRTNFTASNQLNKTSQHTEKSKSCSSDS